MSERSVGRYEALVATIIGLAALSVSGYTAYIQRQQVRAQVWPSLEVNLSNMPTLHVWVVNKGVGPAIVKEVRVSVEGKVMHRWTDIDDWLRGPGDHRYVQSQLRGRVLAPGENLLWFEPHDDKTGEAITPSAISTKLRAKAEGITISWCYCSTLGDCWWDSDEGVDALRPVGRCPARGELSFEQ